MKNKESFSLLLIQATNKSKFKFRADWARRNTQKYKVTDGTTGVVTKREAVLVLEMAFVLKEKLEAKGMQVLMTRTSQDVDISNKERATFANDHKANLFYVFMQMVLKIRIKVDSLY